MDFSITSKLDKRDYIKVMFIGLYEKPYYIIATIFGLFFLTISMLNYFNTISFEVYSPLADAVAGLFLLLCPSIIVFITVSQAKSNPSLLNEMTYTFNDVGVSVIGLTFKSESCGIISSNKKRKGSF